MAVRIRTSSAIRAGGTAAALLLPARMPGRAVARVVLTGVADAAARRIDPVGLQLFAITPDGDANLGVGTTPEPLTQLTSTGSWVAANLLLARLLERSRPPAVVTALGAGAVIYLLDHFLGQKLADFLKSQQQAADESSEG